VDVALASTANLIEQKTTKTLLLSFFNIRKPLKGE
jgi:hypothetical protein